MPFNSHSETLTANALLPAVIALELARQIVERCALATDDPVWSVVAAADSIDDALTHLLAADPGQNNDR